MKLLLRLRWGHVAALAEAVGVSVLVVATVMT
jgi:hypothetical protein